MRFTKKQSGEVADKVNSMREALMKIRELANHPENDSRAIAEIYYIATIATMAARS